MNRYIIIPLAALTLIGLGGFFLYRYGVVEYKRGYGQCQLDGVILATEAGKQLNEILNKPIAPDVTNRMLLINGWLRDEGDK